MSRPHLGPSPHLTCHKHHEDRAAPLSRRDGGGNGALEPQHRSPRAQELAPCVDTAVLELAPPSPFVGPRGPRSLSWPGPRLLLLTNAHSRQRPPGTRASARGARSAPRHVMPHVVVRAAPKRRVSLASQCVRAPDRPQALRAGKWKEAKRRMTNRYGTSASLAVEAWREL